MKKLKYFVLVLFSMLLLLTGCNKQSEKIIVATNAEFAPFEYLDGNEFKGIDMDIIKEYGKYNNVEIEIKHMDFDAALLSVSTGKADLAIAGITKNAKREETLSFSKAYYLANQVVVVNKDSNYASLTNKNDILAALSENNAKIGCQRGTTGQYYIEGSPDWDFAGIANATCKTYDNGALAVTDLVKGNIDAVIIDEAPAKIYEAKFKEVIKLDAILTKEEYCIATKKDNNELVNSLNLFIDKIKDDGTFDEIVNNYYGEDILTKNQFKKNVINILKGLGVTFLITILAFIIGIILGILVSVAETNNSKNIFIRILNKIAKIYVAIFRGTPITVQLLIIYYVIFANIAPLFAAIIAFGLNSGAYVSEIVRGGINSIPKGQIEAGRSLGLNYATVMRKIVLPQALRNCLPSLGNEFVALIKETSVVSFITVIDLYSAFRAIATASFSYKSVYITMGVFYFVIVYFISFILKKLEGKMMSHVEAR